MKQKYLHIMTANLVLMVVSIILTGWYVYRYSTLENDLALLYALICILTALSSFVNWSIFRKRYRNE